MGNVEPGSIVRYGVDDDMTCLVVGNYRKTCYRSDGVGGVVPYEAPALLLYGCMGEPGDWDQGRLFVAGFGELDTVAIVLEPS